MDFNTLNVDLNTQVNTHKMIRTSPEDGGQLVKQQVDAQIVKCTELSSFATSALGGNDEVE